MSNEEDWYTPVSSIEPIVKQIQKTASSRSTHSFEWRKSQIEAIIRLINENITSISDALKADLHQNDFFCYLLETNIVITEAEFALKHLKSWMEPKVVPTPFPTNVTPPVKSYITTQPRGMVLIMSPWNYPLQLCLLPLISAVAAGNCAVIKPSEISVHTAQILSKLIPRYLDNSAIRVVNGSVPQSTELLNYRYDAICYTGGLNVARIVASAASKHLTPVLLELGGKSPAIVCDDADIPTAVMRIVWGKFTLNTGQTCVAVDYALVVESIRERFVTELQKVLIEFYGPDPSKSSDIGRIINTQHTKRLVKLLDDPSIRIVHGGKYDIDKKYIEPTVVEAAAKSTIMQDEIFGPILPIVTISDVDSAIEFVNTQYSSKHNHPLALYIFAKGKLNQQKVLNQTQSGGVGINACALHSGNSHLPFGGVGNSGLNAHHGKYGYDFFSHQRSVFQLDNHCSSRYDVRNWMFYPPYNEKKLLAFKVVGELPKIGTKILTGIKVILPVLVAYHIHQNPGFVTEIREFNINRAIELIGQLCVWMKSVVFWG